jgi:PIN domain nuclease of toxin-antitoxin system
MNVLLDTQTFIWLDVDKGKLSASASQACTDADNIFWLSVASAWEMQIKLALGKLTLNHSLAQTIADQQATNGIQILPVGLDHVLQLQNLGTHHKDPFDRLIIAQAKHEGWSTITSDPEFKAYGVRIIW